MKKQIISRLKGLGEEAAKQAIVSLFFLIIALLVIRWRQHVSILISFGAVWLFIVCFTEFATYRWLVPRTEAMLRQLGQEPPPMPEVKNFRQWFAARGLDIITVVIWDIVVLFALAEICTKFLNFSY